MKVAVPLFGQEVSPRFGCSTQVLIAEVTESGVEVEGAQDLTVTPGQWPELFSNIGVSVVVCGGIHRRFQQELEQRRIRVIWGVIGPAADALYALQAGTLQRDAFLGHGRQRRRGRGRGRWLNDGGGGRGRHGRGREAQMEP